MSTLRKIWDYLRKIFKLLHQSRFSLIIVLITIISLEYVGQIKDILVGLDYPESQLQVTLFILAVNWLAFQSWGWARFIFSRYYSNDKNGRGKKGLERWVIDWLPRLYAVSVFIAAYRAADRANVHGVANGILLVAVVVVLFLVFRRAISEFCYPIIRHTPQKSQHYFTLVVIIVSSFFAIYSPVGFGNLMGAGAVVFLGLGSIIPLGTLLVNATIENRFPVVGSLLLFAVVISPINDNHQVRTLEKQSKVDPITLKQSFEQWDAQADPEKPMVLITTAGGGLRASYWTGVILGRFQDQLPQFNRQIFAISGVSGGSVGAVFYNAALGDKKGCNNHGQTPCFEKKLLQSIGKDYLAPTAASMLYGDLLQRFIPFRIFDDRAAALEESWEVGFKQTYPDSNCSLDQSFDNFYNQSHCHKSQKWMPQLLINGTYEESGKRLLTSALKVEPKVFLDTHDFFQLNEKLAIRASTAALNSARFSYVSPAGTFGKNTGHVIDGGYFENYGAITLSNLINWLKKNDTNFSKRGLIVIAISNDSSIPLQQYQLDAIPVNAKSNNFINEILAPILGLANTRSGHGMLAYKQLQQNVEEKHMGNNTKMVHFYLQPNEGQAPPLGWILSEASKQNMRRQITEPHNCNAYNSILKSFEVNDKSCLTQSR